MQQFQCSLHGTERATTAVYSWPSCGGGCVQNASCIACFTACGTWGKGGAWDKCDCPDECYPEGVIADQTIRILKALRVVVKLVVNSDSSAAPKRCASCVNFASASATWDYK